MLIIINHSDDSLFSLWDSFLNMHFIVNVAQKKKNVGPWFWYCAVIFQWFLFKFTKLLFPMILVLCSHLIWGEPKYPCQETFHGPKPALPMPMLPQSWKRQALFARLDLFTLFQNFLSQSLFWSSNVFSFQAFVGSDEGGDDDNWTDAWHSNPCRNSCSGMSRTIRYDQLL